MTTIVTDKRYWVQRATDAEARVAELEAALASVINLPASLDPSRRKRVVDRACAVLAAPTVSGTGAARSDDPFYARDYVEDTPPTANNIPSATVTGTDPPMTTPGCRRPTPQGEES